MKIRYIKYIFMAMLAITMAGCLAACDGVKDPGAESDTIHEETSGETENETVKYIYKTKYVDCMFVSDAQKAEWKTALVSLLNNEKTPIYEKSGRRIEYSYLYPDRPCIENGYQLALFDFNTDGMPELLVNVGGGTAGNAFYYVYDIRSGEEIGTLNGGHNHSWCIYFNQSTGKYEAIGQFEWRNGWMGKIRFVNKATITHTVVLNETYLHETSLMCAYYEIDALGIEPTEEEVNVGYYDSWEEIYPGVKFWVNDVDASIEAYFDAQDHFTENYIRITDTGIRLIDWDDVTDEEDDVLTKAEKMAEALITSNQKFISTAVHTEESGD